MGASEQSPIFSHPRGKFPQSTQRRVLVENK